MSSEVLGQGSDQEVLSWDPYANLPEFGEQEERTPEGQLSARPEEMKREERQGLGVAAIAGMLKSGLTEEKTTGDSEGEAGVEEVAEYDTVIGRAVQALGAKQFDDFVWEIMDSAEEDSPQETMEKFRGSAEAAAMDAGELWQAVVAQSKKERYPEIEQYREEGKFYFNVGLDDLQKALEKGKLERSDGGGNSLKSDLILSGDRLGDGRWKSGFEEGKAATLVLDGSLMDKDDFVALRWRPSVDEVDLEKYCLGVVSDFRTEAGRKVYKMVRKSQYATIPVYQQYDGDELVWATKMYPASVLREQARQYGEEVRSYEAEKAALYTDVDKNGMVQRIERLTKNLDKEKLGQIILEHGKIRTDEDKENVEQTLIDYYVDVLKIEDAPMLVREETPEKRRFAGCHRSVVGDQIKINTARLDESDLRLLVKTIGEVMWQVHQQELVDLSGKGWDELSDDEKKHAELLRKNFVGDIKLQDDVYQSKHQMKDAEVGLFGEACVRAYDEMLEDVKKPTSQIKRGVRRVGQGARKVMDKVGVTNG